MTKSIVFCGTPSFACPSLQALHDDPAFDVKLVITQPDKKVGRKQVMTAPPVKLLAEELGIAVEQPSDINTEIRKYGNTEIDSPDFLVVVAYGQILSEEVLSWPQIAPVNVHASLLPQLRGASPIQHSILVNHQETGVTIQRMAKELDTGPILAQESIPIGERATSIELFEKLAPLGAKLLVETLKNPLAETPQNEEEATYCGKLDRELGQVNPETFTAEEIDRKVRALVPWPGVRMQIHDEDVKLIATSLMPHPDAFEVLCSQNTTLYVIKMQSPGKKPLTGAQWKQRMH